jgi:mRNA interferase RelE/StbE
VASYKLLIKPSAAKELEAIPKKDRLRIVARIRRLATEPRPIGSEKLSGNDKLRIRQGNYRVVFGVDDTAHEVIIVKIGHRREVYR